jgi:hypothetical protein
MRERFTHQVRSGGVIVIEDEVKAPDAVEIQDLGTLTAAEIRSRVESVGGVYTTKSAGIEFLRGQNNAG